MVAIGAPVPKTVGEMSGTKQGAAALLMKSAEFEKTLAAFVQTVNAATLISGGQTIAPPVGNESISELLERASQGAVRDGATLGEGGMGIVRESEQLAIGRSIAVKTLKPGQHTSPAILKLLQEAWITGALEHPNIVPIYDVQVTDGVPRILLKRIEGKSWADQLKEEEGERDDASLEKHLRILMQVAQAAHFAHTRGFVHRDIKPENVMLGAYGEVYLLDWGIAVAMEDDGTGRFPLASEQHHIAGTPAYMAPEQLGGADPKLGPATDVFLLGATLYELVTGSCPNASDEPSGLLRQVFLCENPVPDSVPSTLRAILQRALARNPGDRFADANELRIAIEDFLEHRGSERLVDGALETQNRLTAAIESQDDDAVDGLFRECVFGYQAALEAWPENERARTQLDGISVVRAAYALENGHLGSARSALRYLSGTPPRHIREALQKAEENAAKKERDLSRLRDDGDFGIAIRTRTFFIGLLGLLLTISPLFHEVYAPSYQSALGGIAGQMVFFLAFIYWARESMFRTRINRTLVTVVGTTILVSGMWMLCGYCFDFEISQARLALFPIWGMGALLGSAALNAKLVPFAFGLFPATFLSAYRPEWTSYSVAAATLLLFAAAFVFHHFERKKRGIHFRKSRRNRASQAAREGESASLARDAAEDTSD